jgi:hypothetical protein
MEVRVLSRIFGHTLQRRADGTHVEFIIVAPEAPPAPPAPPPVDEADVEPSPRHTTPRVSKTTKPPKSPRAPKSEPRDALDLELVGNQSPTRSHHQADLFEL